MSLSDSDRELVAKNAHKRVTDCNKHLSRLYPHLTKALANLEDWGGIGHGSGGDGGGRSSEHGDPAANAALSVLTREQKTKAVKERFERDAFARDHALIIEGLTAAETALQDVERRIDRARALWAKGAKPSVQSAVGCLPCSMVKDPETNQAHESGYQEVYTRRPRPQNPEGPKVPYCHWHADFVARWDVEPSEPIVLWHLGHLGEGQVPRKLIQDQHPASWSRVQAESSKRPMALSKLGLRIAT